MPERKTKMEVLSGSPQMVSKIPQTPPGEAPNKGGAPGSTPAKASKKSVGIIALAAVVLVAGIAFFALRGGSDPVADTPSGGSGGGAGSQSGGLLGGGSGGGASSSDGANTGFYIGNDVGSNGRIFQIGKDIYRHDGHIVFKLSGQEITQAVSDKHGGAMTDVICINGDLYYHNDSGQSVIKVPGGDFSKETEVLSQETTGIFTDGVTVFAKDRGNNIYRINPQNGEVTTSKITFDNNTTFAYDGKFYTMASGVWQAQPYDGAAEEFRTDLDIQGMAGGAAGLAILHGDSGIELMKGDESTRLFAPGEISARLGVEAAKVLSYDFCVDGDYIYFVVDTNAEGDRYWVCRADAKTGVLQQIPIPGQQYREISVVNGWVGIREGVYKIEGDTITGGMVYTESRDERGVLQEGYTWEDMNITLINY